jgi:hypothetical protein
VKKVLTALLGKEASDILIGKISENAKVEIYRLLSLCLEQEIMDLRIYDETTLEEYKKLYMSYGKRYAEIAPELKDKINEACMAEIKKMEEKNKNLH